MNSDLIPVQSLLINNNLPLNMILFYFELHNRTSINNYNNNNIIK